MKLKYFPPYFPQAEWLQKKWWHRLIWVLSVIISICSFYSAVLFTLLFLSMLLPKNIQNLVPYPNSILNTLLFLPTFLPLLIVAPVLNFIDPGNSGNSTFASSLLFIILCLLLSILPSLLYRLMLFIFFGKEWESKKRS